MQKKILWVAAALVLIATPAVIGLVALRGDDGSSSARRAAALLAPNETLGKTTIVMAGGAGGKSTPVLSGKEIDVESFSWGVANNGTVREAGKANFNDFSFTKKTDESSPGLMQSCAAGEHFEEVILNVRKPGEKGENPYLTIVFKDVLISSYQQGGSGGDLPTENISLNYGSIQVTYKAMKADGSLGTPHVGGYNLLANEKF